MADILTYSDFWFLTFLPVIAQSYILGYTVYIRRLIGLYMTTLRAIFQSTLLITYVLFMLILILASGESGTQPIEFIGFWIAFVLPNVLAITSYLEVKHLKEGLTFNPDRERTRHIERDAKRDIKRDIDRDRKMYKKEDKKEGGGEGEEE